MLMQVYNDPVAELIFDVKTLVLELDEEVCCLVGREISQLQYEKKTIFAEKRPTLISELLVKKIEELETTYNSYMKAEEEALAKAEEEELSAEI